VARLILIEALGVNVAGGVAGWFVGTLVARGLGSKLAVLASPVPIDPRFAAFAIVLAVGLGAFGGIYPAIRAARMDPSQALRHI
jgi:putative ABC transport system permease protein